MRIPSYPSIFALGHRVLRNLFDGPVLIEEKVDGSQISFGVLDSEESVRYSEGQKVVTPSSPGLFIRSKGQEIILDAPDNLFRDGVEAIKTVASQLTPGYIYRGEYLKKPKHNTLVYNRIPAQHIVIFDVQSGLEEYLGPETKKAEAARLGFETVPLLQFGTVKLPELQSLLQTTESFLGGSRIEGVVVKPWDYNVYGPDKKVLMGKFVSEVFKELHRSNWKIENPGKKDVLESIGENLRAEGRWVKAIQHLREAGTLDDSPRDIGALIKEIPSDIEKECKDEILQALWKWAWPDLKRSAVRGFPEWYKQRLLTQQFTTEEGPIETQSEEAGDGATVDAA